MQREKSLVYLVSFKSDFMRKGLLLAALYMISMQASAQLGIMKLVGNDTKDYGLGYGAFLKMGYPVSQASDVTLEIGANIFFLNDGYGDGDGTIICPLKAGYRYTLNGTGTGLYIEPQVGYDLFGATSVRVNGTLINQSYHGVVLAAGGGYLFTIFHGPVDFNVHYETVLDDGGSTNYISAGLTAFLTFKKRATDNDQ